MSTNSRKHIQWRAASRRYYEKSHPGSRRNETHGMRRTPEYIIWTNMKARCSDKNRPDFKNYGGRGIQVCPRWRNSFLAFLADMGPRPSPRLTIERKRNNEDYSSVNCKWALTKEQRRNQRRNRNITFRGRTQCLQDWATTLKLHKSSLQWRLENWSLERALTCG